MPMSIQLVSIIGHFAFFLTALSFVVKDIITLRILAIFSSLAAILYNYFHPMIPHSTKEGNLPTQS